MTIFEKIKALFTKPEPQPEWPRCAFCYKSEENLSLFRPTVLLYGNREKFPTADPVKVTFGKAACESCKSTIRWDELINEKITTTASSALNKRGHGPLDLKATEIIWNPL